MRRTVWIAALGMALLLAPMAAQATVSVERINVSQRVVSGSWQYTDSDGNYVGVQVVVGDFGTRGPDPSTTPTPFVSVSILKGDGSTVWLSGSGETEQFTFDLDPQLNQAHVVATLDFFNEGVGAIFPMTIDLTFTATSDVYMNTFHNRFKDGGFKFNAQFKGKQRDATAAGSVIYDATSGIDPYNNGTTNFTPMPTSDALIQKDTAGWVTIQID